MPVRALQQRMAVLIRTAGSCSGSAPSREGDQWPPMAMASSLPLMPTKNWKRRKTGTKETKGENVRWYGLKKRETWKWECGEKRRRDKKRQQGIKVPETVWWVTTKAKVLRSSVRNFPHWEFRNGIGFSHHWLQVNMAKWKALTYLNKSGRMLEGLSKFLRILSQSTRLVVQLL